MHALRPVQDPFLVPYWFVQHSADEKDANVYLESMKSTDGNVTIPVLTNKKQLQAGTALVVHVPAPKAKTKSGPAAKRQKRVGEAQAGKAHRATYIHM